MMLPRAGLLVLLAAALPAEEAETAVQAERIFTRLDRDGDGRLTLDEVPEPSRGQFRWLDANRDGAVTRGEFAAWRPDGNASAEPAVEEAAFPPQPGEPTAKRMPGGDAARDAAGRGQLFESVIIAGVTDIRIGTNGLAIADLDRDGRLDLLLVRQPLAAAAGGRQRGGTLQLLRNLGGWRFVEHPLTFVDSPASPQALHHGQVPVLADFNGDGFLDLFLTRSSAGALAGERRPGVEALGNALLVSDGRWDRFRDVSAAMGIRNQEAYNRQPSLGDLDRDGWLDVAVGCDNIGNAMGGVPHSRLYHFRPGPDGFADGRFVDLGGSDAVPDFGGFAHDSACDRASPDLTLRDLDNDGDLDLVQGCHVDVREPLLPFSPGEYRQGMFCWRNLLAETGSLRFEKITGNGLACEARLRYDRELQRYVVADGTAPGLPYVSCADVDNDGLLDVLAVGPAHPGWAPRAEYVGGRLWRNRGAFRFEAATAAAGLGLLEGPIRGWKAFFADSLPADSTPSGTYPSSGLPRQPPGDLIPYYADAIFGDFDNDGGLDVVVLDRSESPGAVGRAMLFLNRGDGVFVPQPATISGLDAAGICGESADLDGDGLLDLVFAADPDNSSGGRPVAAERYQSRVYWNTGAHGARANHWLRLRCAGIRDAALIGARVEIRDPGSDRLLATRVIAADHSYKSGSPLEAHVGLGGRAIVDVRIVLLDGRIRDFPAVAADRYLEADLVGGELRPVVQPPSVGP